MGDKLLQTMSAGQLSKAIVDNVTHALVGLLSGIIVVSSHQEKLHLAIGCMLISSLIDADHFIAARSLKLVDATSLQSRPFLHNSTIPVVLAALLIYCHFTSKDQNLVLWLIVTVVAFTTHHLRDANRRGLWFSPFGSTLAIHDTIYILLTVATPFLAKQFVPDMRYSRVTQPTIDV